jgi:hypothetical protein
MYSVVLQTPEYLVLRVQQKLLYVQLISSVSGTGPAGLMGLTGLTGLTGNGTGPFKI